MTDIPSLSKRQPVSLPAPAERVRLRKLFGATQAQLAAAFSVTRKTVSEWERGNWEPQGIHRVRYGQLLATWAASEKRIKEGTV